MGNHKRYTACRITSSWHYCSGQKGLPLSWLGRRCPVLDGDLEPEAGKGPGTETGVPPERTWDQRLGYPLERTWDQRLRYPWKGSGTRGWQGPGTRGWGPPPCGLTNKLKTLPSRILRNVGSNHITFCFCQV